MKDITYKEDNIKFNFRVAVIIENNERILVQHSEGDTNERLIGGRVKLLENTAQALVREIKEELNYEAKEEELTLLQIAENFFDYHDTEDILQKVHEILFIYKLYINSNEEIAQKDNFKELDKANITFKWINKQEIKNTKLVPDLAKRVIDEEKINYDIINDLREIRK